MQYGIRLGNEQEMTWQEFSILLQGIMPKTPLGYVVQIRSEENRETLKYFTPEQKRIRDEWRSNHKAGPDFDSMSEAEKLAEVEKVQNMLKGMFA